MPEAVEILLLTQSDCGFCDEAKLLLERLCVEYQLSVASMSISSAEGAELAAAGGIMFPPGLFVAGKPFSYGRVSERKVRRELDRLGATPIPDRGSVHYPG